MSTNDPETPTTPSTPSTPRERVWPSIPNLLNRQASEGAHRRNSSIISIPTSPMKTTMHQPWPIREVPQTPRLDMEDDYDDFVMTSPLSPILDRVPIDAFKSHSASPSISKKPPLQMPPPKYHLTLLPTSSSPATYTSVLTHIQSVLVPLVSVTTGLPHPSFPTTLLQYHLLTHSSLDSLSRHYHQTEPPTQESFRYPCHVPGWVAPSSPTSGSIRPAPPPALDTKRRRFGRFIGLRGCESPSEPPESEEQMLERMEREWLLRLRRAREEEERLDKGWRARW